MLNILVFLKMENLFLVCLIPPAHLVEEIDELRKFISEEFNVHQSLKRPAHITLYEPVKLTSKTREETFFGALQDAAYSAPFEQILTNFGSFPEHTFYINVVQNNDIMLLKSQIDDALRPMHLFEKNRPKFTPHVTLAFRDVQPPVCRAIVAAFKDRKFKRSFVVSGFSVYKHDGKIWQPYREIPFKSPADKAKPLSLFP